MNVFTIISIVLLLFAGFNLFRIALCFKSDDAHPKFNWFVAEFLISFVLAVVSFVFSF